MPSVEGIIQNKCSVQKFRVYRGNDPRWVDALFIEIHMELKGEVSGVGPVLLYPVFLLTSIFVKRPYALLNLHQE